MRLTLIRHGQTTSNVSRALDTEAPGANLTELGISQAASLPQRLKGLAIDALAVSPLVRTQQTAAPLAAAYNLTPIVLDGLREVRAGSMEMSIDPADYQHYFDVVAAWALGNKSVKMHPEEDGNSVLERFDQALDTLCTKGENLVAVSHATVLGYWTLSRVEGMTLEMARDIHLGNTQFAQIEGQPGAWHLLAWACDEL